MPIVDYGDTVEPIAGAVDLRQRTAEVEAPALGETVGAAFRLDNTLGSWAVSNTAGVDFSRVEDGFDVYDELKGTRYDDEGYYRAFAGVFNREAMDATILQIEQEEQDRETIAAAGGLGIAASFGASIFDPTIFLPGGALVRSARGTANVGRSALSVGTAAAVGASLSEASLQDTQVTRSATESALAVGGSFVLGGVLGGAVAGTLSRAEASAISRKIESHADVMDGLEREYTGLSSVGAASVERGSSALRDERLFDALKGLNNQDPMIRLQLNDLDAAKNTVRDLAESPLEIQANREGYATSEGGTVETRIKVWQAPLYRATRVLDDSYAQYFAGQSSRFGRATAPIRGEIAAKLNPASRKLTFKEFKIEVGRAMARNDESPIPEVQAAAQAYRREVFDPLKNEAIGQRLLSEGVAVDTADSYITRVYNKEKIIAERKEFVSRIDRWMAGEQARVATIADEQLDDAARQFRDLSNDEIREIAQDVTDTILGNADGRLPFLDLVQGPRGPLRERTLKIPDEMIEDFLDRDVEQVARIYTRSMSADVELARKFGSVDLSEQIAKINDEANQRVDTAKDATERRRIDKQRRRAIRDVEAIRDRLRGTYAIPSDPNGLVVRAGRVARNLNYIRLLGGMTLSAIPDLAKPVFRYGLTSVMSDGFVPMVRSFRQFRLGAEEVKSAGTALDMVLDSRTMAIADIMDDYGRGSAFERGLSSVSSRFGMVSLMAPWNAAMKQFTGVITMNRILRAVDDVAKGTVDRTTLGKLGAAGISRDMANRIAQQFREHGVTENGSRLANTGQWTDRTAIDAFRAAVVREVDMVVVTPGQDKPLWMSTELGKVVGQFKSFGVSSVQKTLFTGLQQRDAAAFNGMMMMLALGAVTYYVKETAAGRDVSDDPSVWAVNAFDRSGLSGWLMDVNGIMEKFTRGEVGLSMFTGEQISRYASRNVTGAFLGPTADAIQDIFQVSGASWAGDLSEADVRRARYMLPFQNIFYARWLFDQIEANFNEALNVKKSN